MLQASVDHRKFLVNRTLAEKGHTVNHNAKNELKKRKKEKKGKKGGGKKSTSSWVYVSRISVFTYMPGESYCRRLGSLLLYLWHVFLAKINSLVCRLC